jgi:hypothetical protein
MEKPLQVMNEFINYLQGLAGSWLSTVKCSVRFFFRAFFLFSFFSSSSSFFFPRQHRYCQLVRRGTQSYSIYAPKVIDIFAQRADTGRQHLGYRRPTLECMAH